MMLKRLFFPLLIVLLIVSCNSNKKSEISIIDNDCKIESNNQNESGVINPDLMKEIISFLSDENTYFAICDDVDGVENVIDTIKKQLSITFFKAAGSNFFIITLSALPCDAVQFFFQNSVSPTVSCCDFKSINPGINESIFIFDYDNVDSKLLYMNNINDTICQEMAKKNNKTKYAIDDSFKYKVFKFSNSNNMISIRNVPLPEEQEIQTFSETKKTNNQIYYPICQWFGKKNLTN